MRRGRYVRRERRRREPAAFSFFFGTRPECRNLGGVEKREGLRAWKYFSTLSMFLDAETQTRSLSSPCSKTTSVSESREFSLFPFCLELIQFFFSSFNYIFNSVYFVSPRIKNTKSLTFDLTSDQEKLSKRPSGEQQKRIPLQDGQKNRCHVTRMKRYRVTTHSMNMTCIMNIE